MIRNFHELATNARRRDALAVLEAGLQAIDTKRAIHERVGFDGKVLEVLGHAWDLSEYEDVYVIGIGKAALDAASALEEILGDRITGGIVLDVKKGSLKKMESVAGEHPLPTETNVRATGEIIGILKSAGEKDLIIAIISGGGSALLCWPYQLKCDQMRILTSALMASGASIHEINTVRKHLSEIQGGQFAKIAFPATVIGLIFSDVPGDDLGVIASGPTVMDTTTVVEAQEILDRYDLLRACKLPDCELKETPKDPKIFKRVTNILLMSNRVAIEAMEQKAHALGYASRVYSNTLEGEARKIGRLLAGLPRKQEIVLAAGETTVIVKGSGKGGRNQEVALAALQAIDEQTLVLSCASDGIDNTPVAGALADDEIKKKALELGLDPEFYLKNNDAYHFFKKTGGHIETGVTGANVSDLMLAIRTDHD